MHSAECMRLICRWGKKQPDGVVPLRKLFFVFEAILFNYRLTRLHAVMISAYVYRNSVLLTMQVDESLAQILNYTLEMGLNLQVCYLQVLFLADTLLKVFIIRDQHWCWTISSRAVSITFKVCVSEIFDVIEWKIDFQEDFRSRNF